MLACLPPYYSVETVTHLLKNIMKAFLATWIGFPYITFCAEETKSPITDDGGVDNPTFKNEQTILS